MKRFSFILSVFLLVPVLFGAAESVDFGAQGALARSELSLADMLSYSIQDEYLARAEYELIMDEYGEMRPFSNIIRAEEKHIGEVRDLMNTHGVDVPADTAKEHVVLPADLKKALETGVQAEIDNIAMYDHFLSMDLPDDVRSVFESLKSASENHLRAFRNNLRKYS